MNFLAYFMDFLTMVSADFNNNEEKRHSDRSGACVLVIDIDRPRLDTDLNFRRISLCS